MAMVPDLFTDRMRAAVTNAAMGMPRGPPGPPQESARLSAQALRGGGFGTDPSRRPAGLRVVRPQPPALMLAAVEAAAAGRLPPGPGKSIIAYASNVAPLQPPRPAHASHLAQPAAAVRGGGVSGSGPRVWQLALEAVLALCLATGCYLVFGA